jgi:hypothetical protein
MTLIATWFSEGRGRSTCPIRATRKDQRIVASWRRHQAAEPDISTERLVRGDTVAGSARHPSLLFAAVVTNGTS